MVFACSSTFVLFDSVVFSRYDCPKDENECGVSGSWKEERRGEKNEVAVYLNGDPKSV